MASAKDEPWCRFPPHTRLALWGAGVDTPEKLAALSGRELRAVPGIGEKGYKAVRAVVPDPGGEATGELVEQPHGGAIRRGGKRGNKGGRGALKSRVRQSATREFGRRIGMLADFADDAKLGVDERLRAIDLLGKYGPGTQRDVAQFLDLDRAAELVRSLAARVQAHVMDEAVLARIHEDWRDVFRAFFPRA